MLMSYAGQMKKNIRALQECRIRVALSQVYSDGRPPTGTECTTSAERNHGVTAGFKLLAELSTDKSGGATDDTFHDTGSPIREKGLKAP
jgi:hypothetical protein